MLWTHTSIGDFGGRESETDEVLAEELDPEDMDAMVGLEGSMGVSLSVYAGYIYGDVG